MWTLAIGCFVVAFVLASLVEYWMHRLMHVSQKIGERHRDHHRRNEGQGVLILLAGWLRLDIRSLILCGFLRLRSSTPARKPNQVLLDEDAGALCSP
jgi:membrane protein YqaA with SNARE-associated domain